jgi:hypothetical protein
VTWSVHLANRKAFGRVITGLSANRNPLIAAPAERRQRLIIDAGRQSISSANRGPVALDKGMFQGRETTSVSVPLGELRTDQQGRLIVLGGKGSAASPRNRTLQGAFNNDDWFDDVSDGPVTARIRLQGSTEDVVIREPAWALVAPPDYAPSIDGVISLWDVVYDVSTQIDKSLALTAETPVSFTQQIYPILYRVCQLRWVTRSITSDVQGHQPGLGGFFLDPSPFALLSSNDATPTSSAFKRRNAVFRRLRNPNGGGGDMPALNSDETPVAVTRYQHALLERWAAGAFEADWPSGRSPQTPPDSTPLEQLPFEEQPRALDKAALDACVGADFFPGIEAPHTIADRATFVAPFRIRLDPGPEPEFGPGKLTEELALPWHTDFAACGRNWWPSQRPNDVLRGGTVQLWDEGARTGEEMVENWASLGFVRKDPVSDQYIEDERTL